MGPPTGTAGGPAAAPAGGGGAAMVSFTLAIWLGRELDQSVLKLKSKSSAATKSELFLFIQSTGRSIFWIGNLSRGRGPWESYGGTGRALYLRNFYISHVLVDSQLARASLEF